MEYYTWILSFHIVAFMSWMSMLFYLPRLFVYHVENEKSEEFVSIVKIQEYKLYAYIGNPAMYAAIISGCTMLFLNPALFSAGDWLYAKLITVFLMILYSLSLNFYRKQLKNNSCKKSSKFFRAYNELPTALAILIVTYVIVKSVSILFTSFILLLFIFTIYKIMTKKDKNEL